MTPPFGYRIWLYVAGVLAFLGAIRWHASHNRSEGRHESDVKHAAASAQKTKEILETSNDSVEQANTIRNREPIPSELPDEPATIPKYHFRRE